MNREERQKHIENGACFFFERKKSQRNLRPRDCRDVCFHVHTKPYLGTGSRPIQGRDDVLRAIAASRLIFLISGFDLFVGPLVSVHLHHPLPEHIECVFFVLLPVSTQPFPF